MQSIAEEMIRSFSREELRDFRYFLKGRGGAKEEREDMKLLEAIRRGDRAPANGNAYHQTRRRLKRQLELFVQQGNAASDAATGILNDMGVAKFFFGKNLYPQAWHYLDQAERKAIAQDEHFLLDYVYHTRLNYALSTWPVTEPAFSIPSLLEKKDLNGTLVRTDSSTSAAYALLLYEIRELFARRIFGNLDQVIERILRKYDLQDRIYDNPRSYCRIVNMVCRALRESKDYANLKIYSMSSYRTMSKRKMFNRIPHELAMDLYRSVYLSSVRTKDYATARRFREIYDDAKEKMAVRDNKYVYFDFRSNIMHADLCMFTGKLKEARQTLTGLEKKYTKEYEHAFFYFFLRINLLAVHFKHNEIERCLKIYAGLIQRYGKKVLKEEGLGLEMLLFTELYGAVFYYERGDHEYALYLTLKVRRKYSRLFTNHEIDRELFFTRILEKMIRKEDYIGSEKFAKDCEKFTALKEYIPGDKEYISLAAWLESRCGKGSYYECFLTKC